MGFAVVHRRNNNNNNSGVIGTGTYLQAQITWTKQIETVKT